MIPVIQSTTLFERYDKLDKLVSYLRNKALFQACPIAKNLLTQAEIKRDKAKIAYFNHFENLIETNQNTVEQLKEKNLESDLQLKQLNEIFNF